MRYKYLFICTLPWIHAVACANVCVCIGNKIRVVKIAYVFYCCLKFSFVMRTCLAKNNKVKRIMNLFSPNNNKIIIIPNTYTQLQTTTETLSYATNAYTHIDTCNCRYTVIYEVVWLLFFERHTHHENHISKHISKLFVSIFALLCICCVSYNFLLLDLMPFVFILLLLFSFFPQNCISFYPYLI